MGITGFEPTTCRLRTKDGNFTHGYGYPRVPYPHGQGMGTLLCPWVVPIPCPLSHGQGTGIASYPRVYPYPAHLLLNSYVTRLFLLTYELEYENVIFILC
jgi:hypothetical protein